MKPKRSMINKNKSRHNFDAPKTCLNLMFLFEIIKVLFI